MITRLKQLQKVLLKKRIRAFWVVKPENIFYLTGYASDLKLLITPRRGYIITDSRSAGLLRRRVKNFQVVELVESSAETVARLVKQVKARTLFTEDDITIAGFKSLQKKFKLVKAVASPITELRLLKDQEEIFKLKQAIKFSKSCLRFLRQKIKPGMKEKQIVWLIERYMHEHGAQGLAFAPVVAVGANAAIPHHQPGEARVRFGAMLLLDFGAKYQGYHADLTRTWFFGRPSAKFSRLARLAEKAQRAGLRFIQEKLKARKPMTDKQVDKAIREFLERQGVGQYFIHGSGHGLGLEIHEAPSFRQRSNSGRRLQNGMVFTLEPGLYLPGWGGVRVEDDFAIWQNKLIKL